MARLADLAQAWRQEAATIRQRYADESLAKLCEAHADDLESALQSADEQLLTPAQAAVDPEVLWDSPDHVALQIRTGKVKNHGKPGRPLARRGDLPKKPSKKTGHAPMDSSADAADAAPLDSFTRRVLARRT